MARDYPMLRSDGKVDGSTDVECEACDKPATHYVRVAWDYMRGNDDSYFTCPRHLGIARRAMRQFVAHVSTKERFLGREGEKTDG